MRSSTHNVSDILPRTALFLVLAVPFTHVAAVDQSDDRASARKSVGQQKSELERTNRPVDPKYAAGWQHFCADNPEKGGCEVMLQRLGSKPVIGVLFAPDPGGGVRIAGVTPDGAGAAAGLKSGDRLLRIGGKTIEGNSPEARVENARRMLQDIDEKTAVKLRYARGDRETEIDVTPRLDSRIMVFSGDGTMMRPDGNVIVRRIDRNTDISADTINVEVRGAGPARAGQDTPQVFVFTDRDTQAGTDGQTLVDTHVIRIDCKGDQEECREQAQQRMIPSFETGDPQRMQTHVFRFDCKPGEDCSGQQRLSEAFRWNGLNLASVDAQLGRYFGTDKGVLVLSTGAALGLLQAGDVIQRVDGRSVQTPRAVMDALRDKPADSTVAVDYLRDRKSASTQIKVPKAMPFPQMPPMPPALPAPPAPPALPHPPNAGAAPHAPVDATVTQRRIVMVDKDGHVHAWEDDDNGPVAVPPPPAPPAPPAPPPPRGD